MFFFTHCFQVYTIQILFMPPITMSSVNLTEEAAKLLDFNQKLDINLLDNIVSMMYGGDGTQVNGKVYRYKFSFTVQCQNFCFFFSRVHFIN